MQQSHQLWSGITRMLKNALQNSTKNGVSYFDNFQSLFKCCDSFFKINCLCTLKLYANVASLDKSIIYNQ